MHNILIKPVITEKSMADANKGTFTFIVDRAATKRTIKEAVEKFFNVTVVKVATAVVKGKTQRNGVRRVEVITAPIKKAYVGLKSGEKIDVFELGA